MEEDFSFGPSPKRLNVIWTKEAEDYFVNQYKKMISDFIINCFNENKQIRKYNFLEVE